MDSCYILNSNQNINHNNVNKLRFKYQNIFSSDVAYVNNFKCIHKYILGSELLIDIPESISAGLMNEQIEKLISSGGVVHDTIDAAPLLWNKKRVFINIERNNLCDVRVLKKILMLCENLKLAGVELVIEVTERDFCGNCPRIVEGLTHLKLKGISLACDDYEYINTTPGVNDKELLLYYDYIKLEIPREKSRVEKFNKFIHQYGLKKKIIIERIETTEQVDALDLNNVWGLQGFLYCKEISIPKSKSVQNLV